MQKLGMSLFAGALLFGAMACDDGVADTAGNSGRCQKICKAANECSDAIDVDECREECTDNSEDDGFEEKAEDCSACIEPNNECVENLTDCTTECAGVVAFSAS
jgi:hypothetical protein